MSEQLSPDNQEYPGYTDGMTLPEIYDQLVTGDLFFEVGMGPDPFVNFDFNSEFINEWDIDYVYQKRFNLDESSTKSYFAYTDESKPGYREVNFEAQDSTDFNHLYEIDLYGVDLSDFGFDDDFHPIEDEFINLQRYMGLPSRNGQLERIMAGVQLGGEVIDVGVNYSFTDDEHNHVQRITSAHWDGYNFYADYDDEGDFREWKAYKGEIDNIFVIDSSFPNVLDLFDDKAFQDQGDEINATPNFREMVEFMTGVEYVEEEDDWWDKLPDWIKDLLGLD